MDTIFALSSGTLPSGVAVVRLSGPDSGRILSEIAGELPPPRSFALRDLRRPTDEALIDRGLAIWIPGPASFTAQDMAELHVHGGRAVVDMLARTLLSLGARLAEPGEFTRRAFISGKLDLTEVEGLSDLIAAETEAQQRQAVGPAAGAFCAQAEDWRKRLIDLRAEIEARLDFSDEGDVPDVLRTGIWSAIDVLRAELTGALAASAGAERVREGFRVAILGPPNAGKSTLLNALARRDVAIVTAEAGTTRDLLEVALDLGGYPVVLFDTAGLRETISEAEREGVRRAKEAARHADLVLWLEPCGSEPGAPPGLGDAPVWRICSKVDLGAEDYREGISALTGFGMIELITRLQDEAARSMGREPALITRHRQSEAVAAALAALEACDGVPDEIAADLLRLASDAIGRLSGRVDVEDVLDRLFAEFCIGK